MQLIQWMFLLILMHLKVDGESVFLEAIKERIPFQRHRSCSKGTSCVCWLNGIAVSNVDIIRHQEMPTNCVPPTIHHHPKLRMTI